MSSCQVYIGTSGWLYDHWKGRFYPVTLPKHKWFDHYIRHFRAVEINATFYRYFKPKTYQNWADKAPENFSYVLKVPRLITHRKYLVNCDKDINDFEKSAMLLKDKLGLLLLQLAPQITFNPELLKITLSFFHNPSTVAVEFRNKTWLADETLKVLKEFRAVFTNIDSPNITIHDQITSKTVYLRLHGKKKWYQYCYPEEELHYFADLVMSYISSGSKKVYVFFNNDFEGYAPLNALRLREILSF